MPNTIKIKRKTHLNTKKPILGNDEVMAQLHLPIT